MQHFFGLLCRPPADSQDFEARKTEKQDGWNVFAELTDQTSYSPAGKEGNEKTNQTKTHFHEVKTGFMRSVGRLLICRRPSKNIDGN